MREKRRLAAPAAFARTTKASIAPLRTGYALIVDGHVKATFAAKASALVAGTQMKNRFPTPKTSSARWLRSPAFDAPIGGLCGVGTMNASSTGDKRAMNILRELQEAEKELVGKAVVLTDGKAGTIDGVFLDDEHGLRISIAGHEGRWPISTVKQIES